MLKALTLDTVELGNCKEAVDDALQEICKDVVHRSLIDKPRKVTLEISLTPKIQTNHTTGGTINAPEIDWKVKQAVPGKTGMTTRAFVEGEEVKVNTGDPLGTDPHQQTFEDVDQ